jgi:hypothetical protein
MEELSARIDRLVQVSLNLAREELQVSSKGALRLLYRERCDYAAALRAAVAGLEQARVVLSRARHRVESQAKEK